MWPKPKKKGKTKNKLNAIEPEKIPDGPEQIELLRKNSGTNSGVHQGREADGQPREDISGVWKASLMKAIAPGTPSQVSTDSMPKMKIPVNRDVLEAQEKQRRQAVFQAVIRIIDRMFDNFQNTAYGFNQVASGSDLELTWMRPQVREENLAAWHEGRSRLCQIFSGRISTRFWTMLVRGTDEGIGVYIMPADKVLSFTPEDKNFLCYLTMSPNFDAERNFTQFLANGLPVSEDLYPSIFRALLDALIRFANEEATGSEVFDFGEIGIVPEAPPPPKEVKEASVSSSFNADVPRTSYAEAVQQIQAHNKAGHVDQLITNSTNARPVDPNEFIRGNSGNFQSVPPAANSTNKAEEWKGFGSSGTQNQFQSGSQSVLQSQSGSWRTPDGQPVSEPANPAFNAENNSDGSGAWNFISKNEIQTHQKNSGSQQIPQNFYQQQTQPNQPFQQSHQAQQQQPFFKQQQPQPQPQQQSPQQGQPYRHPLEQQVPSNNLRPHSMAESGIISEFTMPDFQHPSRAELEQLREGARPPINQSQEMAGASPVFKLPAEAGEQIMEQEQFELLSENPPEMSGDFAPITISDNYASLEAEESTEIPESEYAHEEAQEDEFDAISESESEIEIESEQIEESLEEAEFDASQSEEFDSEEAPLEEQEDVEDSLEESQHEIEEDHVEEDLQNVESAEDFDDNEILEETEDEVAAEDEDEIEAETEAEDEIESESESESEAEEVAGLEEDIEEGLDSGQPEEVEIAEDSEEIEVIEVEESSQIEDVDETLELEESDEAGESEIVEELDKTREAEEAVLESKSEDSELDESSDSDQESEIDLDSSSTTESDSEDESDENVETSSEAATNTKISNESKTESKDSVIEESAKNSEKIDSAQTTDPQLSSDIGMQNKGGDDKSMPAFTKFPSLSTIEITLGKCPDLSDALFVLLPVLDAQIDELAAQGGKAFTTKDFKRAEAIIKLTEKLEDFKTEASAILNLIDDDEDEDEDKDKDK